MVVWLTRMTFLASATHRVLKVSVEFGIENQLISFFGRVNLMYPANASSRQRCAGMGLPFHQQPLGFPFAALDGKSLKSLSWKERWMC